jgi:excisionase family DNA binding protein
MQTEAPAPDRKLLNVREAAAALGISPDSVYRLVADGRIAPVRLGPRAALRFKPSDLDELIEECRTS